MHMDAVPAVVRGDRYPRNDCNFDTILGCNNEILSKIQTKKKWHYDKSIMMLLCSLMFENINPSKSLYLKKKLRQSRPGDLRDSIDNQLRMDDLELTILLPQPPKLDM